VISDEFWRRRLSADADLRGGADDVEGNRYDVIGVVRPGFAANPAADVWLPLQADPYSFDHTARVRVAAHLAAGTTLTMAQRQLGFAMGPFLQKFPDAAGPRESATAVPLREVAIGDIRPAFVHPAGRRRFRPGDRPRECCNPLACARSAPGAGDRNAG
jgi:hypothetical protein